MSRERQPDKKKPASKPPDPKRSRKPRSESELAQVGKRPSSPLMLAATGLAWIVCGVVALTKLTATWKFIPAIFFIGVGLLWIRGAAVTLARHDRGGGKQPPR